MLAGIFERCMKRRGVRDQDAFDWEKVSSSVSENNTSNISPAQPAVKVDQENIEPEVDNKQVNKEPARVVKRGPIPTPGRGKGEPINVLDSVGGSGMMSGTTMPIQNNTTVSCDSEQKQQLLGLSPTPKDNGAGGDANANVINFISASVEPEKNGRSRLKSLDSLSLFEP